VWDSDFFHSYSAPVLQKLTPAPGVTPDKAKFTDSCSCLTPANNLCRLRMYARTSKC